MESPSSWFERQLSRAAARSLAWTALVGSTGSFVALSLTETAPTVASAVSLGAGALAAGCRLAASFVANPTGPAYLARYTRHTPVLRRSDEPVEASDDAVAAIDSLRTLGFDDLVTLVDDEGEALVHVLTGRESRVCAVVTDATGATSVHSRLVDGRILTTTTGLVAPSAELVVNPCDTDGAVAVVRRHAQVLRLMFETRLVADESVSLTVAALAAERRAWAALRPSRAALAHVAGRRGLVRVQATVPEDALLVHTALAVAAPDAAPATDLIAAAEFPAAVPHRAPRGETPPRVPLRLWEDPPIVPRGGGLRELEPQGV